MKIIGKAFLIVTILCCMLSLLTGCGSSASKAVPDSVVELTIKNKYPELENSTYSIASHSYDRDAHYDTVTLEWRKDLPYMYQTWSEEIVYQYNKATENWEYKGSECSDTEDQYKTEEIIGNYTGSIEQQMPYRTMEYNIDIVDVDMEKNTIRLKGTATVGCRKYNPRDIFDMWVEETDCVIDGDYALEPGALSGDCYDNESGVTPTNMCAVTDILAVGINANHVKVLFPTRF